MAQVQSLGQQLRPTTPPQRPLNAPLLSPSRMPNQILTQQSFKGGNPALDAFSPVDQNGSFCFDRVIKSGKVNRRVKKKGAWKASWKSSYLVLRPNLLSIYKDEEENQLSASVSLSEVNAVTTVKKSNTANVFGVFSPSKNHHFQGLSEADTADWILRIRQEAKTHEMDELEELEAPTPMFSRAGGSSQNYDTTDLSADESPEPPGSPEIPHWSVRGGKSQTKPQGIRTRRTSNLQDYSANEILTTSHSDFSDVQTGSIPKSVPSSLPKGNPLSPIASSQQLRPPMNKRTTSQISMSHNDALNDPERIIRQGWLQILRTKTGVKSWKDMWCVLRPRNLCFYKNEQEYSTIKLIPMSSIIDAAEIDYPNRNKEFCFQIIVEDKTYRLCAADEEDLTKWLGALKSVLSRRAEMEKARAKSPVADPISASAPNPLSTLPIR